MNSRKILLNESDTPRQWYNLAADLPTPLLPPLGPDGNPVSPDMLAPVFPMNLIEQEGFIRVLPNKGIYVTDISLNDKGL